jgi:hypothetical protein
LAVVSPERVLQTAVESTKIDPAHQAESLARELADVTHEYGAIIRAASHLARQPTTALLPREDRLTLLRTMLRREEHLRSRREILITRMLLGAHLADSAPEAVG